jgi:hypothetical protein
MGIAYFLDIARTWDRFALIVRVAHSHPDLYVSPQVSSGVTAAIGTGQLM